MILYLDDEYTLETGFWRFTYANGEKTVKVFSFLCLLHSFLPFWMILRVLRMDITPVFCNKKGFGFFCLGKLYFYDLEKSEWRSNKNFRSKRPLKIDFDDQLVYFGDYMSNSNRNEIGVYRYAVSDNSLTKIHRYNGIRHVHCVKLISYDEMVILCGDYGDEARMSFLDKEGNIGYELIGEGQPARSVDCFRDEDYLYYGMDTQLEQNYLCRYSLQERSIEKLQKVEGPVFNIWRHAPNVIGFTVSCEVGLDNIDTISICTYNQEDKKITELHSYTMPVKLNKVIQKTFGVPTFDIYRNSTKMIVSTNYYLNIFRKQISLKA